MPGTQKGSGQTAFSPKVHEHLEAYLVDLRVFSGKAVDTWTTADRSAVNAQMKFVTPGPLKQQPWEAKGNWSRAHRCVAAEVGKDRFGSRYLGGRRIHWSLLRGDEL